MNSAIKHFGQDGYRATSTEAISEAAGYSQASLFFHFKNKKGLLEACFDKALAQMSSVNLTNSDSDSLINYLEKMDDIFDDQITSGFISRMLSDAHGNEELLSVYTRFHDKIGAEIAHHIMRESGANENDASFIAAALLCMSIGVHSKRRTEIQEFSRSEYRRMLTLVGESLLAYLQTAHTKVLPAKSEP